jgi:prepilin-type N-terminal cleavage/methylation domain-containing protein
MRNTKAAAFTMVEVLAAIAIAGIGITSTVAALTRLNQFASTDRNATGAYAALMTEIDKIQSATPFNPQAGQIPAVLTPGVHPAVPVEIYREDPSSDTVVSGTTTSTVVDVSTPGVAAMYRATVTVNYTYRNRPYTFSMSTLRASDQ